MFASEPIPSRGLVYFFLHLVDFFLVNVGKFTSPMDARNNFIYSGWGPPCIVLDFEGFFWNC